MAMFWVWAVRNPCVLLAAVVMVAGLADIADWSISITTVMVLGLIAQSASHLARRARARSQRRRAAVQAIEDALAVSRRYHERAA